MTGTSDIVHAMTVFSPAKPTSATAPPSASHPAREAVGHTLRSAASPARPVKASGETLNLPRYWPTWTMLTVFIFIGFECILLAPGLVCSIKAWDMWKQLKRAVED